jgi:hypothetical protein
MAAIFAFRVGGTLVGSPEVVVVVDGKVKCRRRCGRTNVEDEGAKNTIHHGVSVTPS